MAQTLQHDVMSVIEVLKAAFPQLVFGNAGLFSGQVRMHFAGYDEENHAFRPYAGLAAARMIWSKAPEPTVIFGFESVEFLRCSPDAVILEQEGVAWLPYTSTYDEIRQAIKKVLSVSPENNDRRIDQLSEEDFNRELQDFGHIFNPNIIPALTIRRKDMASADPETRERLYLSFREGNPDYLGAHKVRFEHLLSKYRGMPFTVKHQAELEKVRQWLDEADREWMTMLALAQTPFSNEAVGNVEMKLSDIIANLDKMYTMTKKIRSHSSKRDKA